MGDTISVAEALLKFLSQNGIDTLFGVVGDAVFPFFDALGKQQKVRFYGTSHEAGAAFMASYYAKLTGKVSVCIATSGPGSANLINGLAEAYFDKAPVLAITGQVQTKQIGTNAKQYINQQALMQPVVKSSELVTSAESVIPIVAKALVTAVSAHTVTHVSIPADLFSQRISSSTMPEVTPKTSARWGEGWATSLEAALMLLQSSKKPLVFVGNGKQEWRDLLVKLAAGLGAGIVLAQQAKGVVPDSHPLVLGGIGEAYVPSLISEADAILLIGTASFETKFFPDSAKIIQLVENQEDLDYTVLNTGVVGGIRQLIEVLSERVSQNHNQSWMDEIAREKLKLNKLVRSQEQNRTVPIHPANLMVALSRALPADSVIVCDIGAFIHWFDTYFQAVDHTVLVSTHWRSMGGGLPGALSACIARPGKKVVALVGDGGLLMALGELATAVKYRLPVTVVVANNHQYNLEKSKMEFMGLKPFGYDITTPDFAAVAKAFGGEGRQVTEPSQLETVLKESMNTDKPFVIDVNLDTVALPHLGSPQ